MYISPKIANITNFSSKIPSSGTVLQLFLQIRVKNVLSDNGFYSTTSRTTVLNPPYGPPRADEKLQIITDNNEDWATCSW